MRTATARSSKPKRAAKQQQMAPSRTIERGVWSAHEHDKFLAALKLFPEGPWKMIAEQVGTRSARQVQTHAQKYYEKVARRLRGLRKDRKKLVRPEHRLDDDMVTLCKAASSSSSSDDALATELRGGPVRRGLNPIAALSCARRATAVGSPAAVDVPVDALDLDTLEPRTHADSLDSVMEPTTSPQSPQWWAPSDDESDLSGCDDIELSDATDSIDDSDSLLDFDDYCLDYLIEVLGSSESAHDASTCSISNNDNDVAIICVL